MRHFRVGQAKFGFFKNHFLTTVAILKDLNQKSGKSWNAGNLCTCLHRIPGLPQIWNFPLKQLIQKQSKYNQTKFAIGLTFL